VTRSDGELLRAHLAGDPMAFRELADRYYRLLWRIALDNSGNPEDAADAVQDALLRAHQAAATCRADGSISGWLGQIQRNVCRDRHRRARSRPAEPIPAFELDQVPAPRNPIAEHENRMVVHAALAELPPEQRAVVVLVELYGYPVSEAAERLGIAVGTVKSRGSRARVRLQQIMRALQPAAEER